MFDLGFGIAELILIATLSLIILGPKDFPKMMVKLGKIIRNIKDLGSEFKGRMDDVVHEEELLKIRKDLNNKLDKYKNDNEKL